MTRPVIRFCLGVSLAISVSSCGEDKRQADDGVPFGGNDATAAKLVGQLPEASHDCNQKNAIHGFGGKEVHRADEVEPSLPNAAVRVASVNPLAVDIALDSTRPSRSESSCPRPTSILVI
jgi:hypothetical protein